MLSLRFALAVSEVSEFEELELISPTFLPHLRLLLLLARVQSVRGEYSASYSLLAVANGLSLLLPSQNGDLAVIRQGSPCTYATQRF